MTNKFEDVWKYIDKKSNIECWEWTRSLNTQGYGQMNVGGNPYLAHRIVYELTYNQIPYKLCVLHSCDNPKCCNPEHLFIGSRDDNNKDKKNKGRSYHPNHKGELNQTSKLTCKDIKEIRNLYSTGKYTQKELGNMFGVVRQNIGKIINHKRWKHI